MGLFLTQSPQFWGPWGVNLVILGSSLVTRSAPWTSEGAFGGQMLFFIRFRSTWGAHGGHFGEHFGVILVIFSDLLVSKWEVGLRTAFWMLSEWIKGPKTVAGCAETIVNMYVFVRFHSL